MKLFFFLIVLVSCSNFQRPQMQTRPFVMAWSKNLDPYHFSGNLFISTGAPRIYNDILYQGSLSGEMMAFDLESGRIIWSAKENTELGAPAEFFNDHIVYGGVSGRLFVRHYLTGKLKYAIDLGSPVESAPVFHDGRLIIYLRGHQIVQLDAETGKILWTYSRAIPITTTLQRTSKPLVLGNKIILGFADGYVGALSLQEGVILWETQIAQQSKFVDVDLNPIKVGNVVVIGSPSGELKAINPDNGAINRDFNINVTAHPLLKGEQLLLGTGDGEILLLGLDGAINKKSKISKNGISAISWWKNNIVAASFDGLVRIIDPITLNEIGSFHLGHEYSSVYSDIVVYDDYLAFFSSRNRLYVMK